jgi:hypothetical protein
MNEPSAAARMSQAASAGRMLAPGQIDELGKAVLLLARELWTVKDRQLILEAALAERGVDVRDLVRDWQPDAALAAELAAERKRFVETLLATLCPPEGTP